MKIILDARSSQAGKAKHIHKCWQDLFFPKCKSEII